MTNIEEHHNTIKRRREYIESLLLEFKHLSEYWLKEGARMTDTDVTQLSICLDYLDLSLQDRLQWKEPIHHIEHLSEVGNVLKAKGLPYSNRVLKEVEEYIRNGVELIYALYEVGIVMKVELKEHLYSKTIRKNIIATIMRIMKELEPYQQCIKSLKFLKDDKILIQKEVIESLV